MPARILIVDDHEIVREGIRTLLAKSGEDWEVCGQAANAEDAVAAVKSLHPDLMVLDVTMPGASGLTAARSISLLQLTTRILIFTMHEFPRLEVDVREAGAHGYVLKSRAAHDLVMAIRALLQGGTFFGAAQEQGKNEAEPRRSPRGYLRFSTQPGLAALFPAFQ